MRKRIVIGFAVVAVVGVGGYLLSQPRKGTVEYHKELAQLRNGPSENWITRNAPRPVRDIYVQEQIRTGESHYDALARLGVFEDRVFVISNRSPYAKGTQFCLELHPHFRTVNVTPGLVEILAAGSNTVTIRAPRDEMDEVEKAVRKFDVPEKRAE